MEQIAVDSTGPKSFILAPDGGVSTFQPENDQIWALSLDASETSPFHLHTTYQLRARSMRVFPNILIGQNRLTKPEDFSLPPTVTGCTPSAIHIKFQFTNLLQVRFSSFIPEPDILAGNIAVANAGNVPISINVEMGAVLIPMGQGNPIHPDTIGSNHILTGQTEDLYPVLFTSGGPTGTNNPHPALRIPLILEPGQTQEVQWVLVSKSSQINSFNSARQWVAEDWRRKLQIHTKAHEKKMVFIKTGNPEWDTAFYLAQVNALTHLVSLNPGCDQPTFIRTRLPDQPKRTHKDQNGISDLTLLDVLHLAQVVLPAHADHLTSLIENFIVRVDDQGMLRSQTQRWSNGGTINEPPLLASLCLMLYEINADPDFLTRVYPNLRRFFEAGWLKNASQDPNNLPAWDTPAQLQLDSGLFNFDIWEETGNGLDIHTAESPAMAAMLYREALALKQFAHILGERSPRNQLGNWVQRFQEKMRSLWNDAQKIFSYQDILTHQAPTREIYYDGRVKETVNIAKQFTQPQRLQIQLKSQEEHPQSPVVRLEGQNAAGERATELIKPPTLRWIGNRAYLTTQEVFSALETVYFEGFNPDDRFLIKTADYSQPDISCLLPIWSGGIHNEQLTAVVDNWISDHIPDRNFGIPETWPCEHPLPDGLRSPVNIQWNTLIIDGLAREGYSAESVKLFTSMMSTIIQGMKDYYGFYPLFDHITGTPIGAANTISGLVPIGLFLKIAGIKLLSPDRVAIWGENPFPWPVEVRWQGLWLWKKAAQTQMIFPDGTRYHSQTTNPRIVNSGKEKEQP